MHPSKGHVCSGRNAGGKNRCQQVACRAISAELDGLLWGASRVVDGGVQWCSFERGYDAHASSDNRGGHDDPGGRPGHGSTLRSSLSGLLPEVGGGRLHRHRLQLYIIGSVQDDGVGTLSYVLRQPILAASTSGIAGRRPSATRPRLLGHGCDTAGSSSRAEVIDLIVIHRLGAHAALARPARASSAASGAGLACGDSGFEEARIHDSSAADVKPAPSGRTTCAINAPSEAAERSLQDR